jgi:peptide/nickel transport system substrate-binding protein
MEAFDQYWRKKPSVHRLVFKVIPDESTRLAALKRGEIDIAYSIRGELAEELQRTKGLTLKPTVIQPRHRLQDHQPRADPRAFQNNRQHHSG